MDLEKATEHERMLQVREGTSKVDNRIPPRAARERSERCFYDFFQVMKKSH
jgi:hypothetical protein